MDFNPTRRTGNVLTMIIHAPSFHERNSNRAHLRQLVSVLEATSERLSQHVAKNLMIEDLQLTSLDQFAHDRRMRLVDVIEVPRLHENRVAQTRQVDVAFVEHQVDALSDMLPSLLDGRIAIHVGQQTQTYAVVSFRRISETVDGHGRRHDAK